MKELKKLTREEMKKVKGGENPPACENECGGTAGTCGQGKTCNSQKCSSDPNFYYNYCA